MRPMSPHCLSAKVDCMVSYQLENDGVLQTLFDKSMCFFVVRGFDVTGRLCARRKTLREEFKLP